MPTLLDHLKAGDIEAFNLARPERGRVDLFAVELEGARLVGVDLAGANIAKSDLTGADLTDATLSRTDMVGIDGEGIILRGAMGLKARLMEAYMVGADLTGADLARSNLAEATLDNATGEGVRLGQVKLKSASCKGVHWPDALLEEAHLSSADFTGADLSRADLTSARCSGTAFDGAKLTGASMMSAYLGESSFVGADLSDANLVEANLSGADLTNADLSRADLTKANLTGAKLAGAKLASAVLKDARLEEVDLSGLDLSGVDLTGHDPRGLGLAPEQMGQLFASGAGAEVEPDAPLRFAQPSVAVSGAHVAALWENADTEERASLRWVVAKGTEHVAGMLPVSPDGVLARTVVPTADGFWLVLLQDRPGGTAVVVYPVSKDGTVDAPRVHPLGYPPAVLPAFVIGKGELRIWGLARRGPTLVGHRLDAEDLHLLSSERVATAQGLLCQHTPVLACKGGVLLTAGDSGVHKPRSTPDGFPAKLSVAAPAGDKVLAVWNTAKAGRDQGGLRYAWLPARGSFDEIEVLTATPDVAVLDGAPVDGGVQLLWTQLDRGMFAPPTVWVCRLPDQEPRELESLAGLDLEEVGLASAGSVLWGTTVDEGLVVADLTGKLIARVGE